MSIANYQAERRSATKRREAVTSEILEILTRDRDDEFSPVILRAHMVAECVGIKGLIDQIAAAGAAVSDDMRKESLLAAAVLCLNRLME